MPFASIHLLALCHLGAVQCGIETRHAKFEYDDGVLQSVVDPSLRLNLQGGNLQAGDKLVLWACQHHSHERFNFTQGHKGQIKALHNPGNCVNAVRGVSAGAKIIMYRCNASGLISENEDFEYGEDGRIRLRYHRNMCINIKEANITLGAEIVLYPCGEDETHDHDIFGYEDNIIFSKTMPHLHLNVKGGSLDKRGDVVLWTCHAHPHEVFDFEDEMMKVRGTNLCIHSEGGLGIGVPLVAWPCTEKGKQVGNNELFAYDKDRSVIYSVKEPTLGFNIKDADVSIGAEIVLWPIVDTREDL